MPESAMSPQDALVAVMVACSASDQDVRTAELATALFSALRGTQPPD